MRIKSDAYECPRCGYQTIQKHQMRLHLYSYNNIKDLNMFYDEPQNQISVYICGKWTHYSIEEGVKNILEIIKENFWDKYECNLIRTKAENIEEHMSKYYKYLAAFDLLPFVKGQTDYDILYDTDDNRYGTQRICSLYQVISNRFMKIYTRVKDEMDPEFKRDIFEKVFAIIRENTKRSLSDLNDEILKTMNMSHKFKSQIESNRVRVNVFCFFLFFVFCFFAFFSFFLNNHPIRPAT